MNEPKVRLTQESEYANYLRRRDSWWRRLFQAPYKLHLLKLDLGRTLEIGCGTGRNLRHLRGNAGCCGVDENEDCVIGARAAGLNAHTVSDFFASNVPDKVQFDSILIAHVLEHCTREASIALLSQYLPFLRKGGRVVIVTPQERGQQEDYTHVQWVDFAVAKQIVTRCALQLTSQYSFPFPRFAGRYFRYNEFVTIALKLN